MDAQRTELHTLSTPDGSSTHGYSPVTMLCRTALEALMVVDDDRHFMRVNLPSTELFRANSGDLTSARIDNYTSAEFGPLLDPLWDSFEREGELRGRYEVQRGDGSTQLVEYSAAREFVRGSHLIAAREVTEDTPQSQPVGFALVEPFAGRFIEVSSELCGLLSRTRDDLLADGSLGLFNERTAHRPLLNAARDIVQGRSAAHDASAEAPGPDGNVVPLSLSLSRVTGQDRRSVWVLLQVAKHPHGDETELTPRQTQILGLIARGFTDREIGHKLDLSVRTVEWHRERLRMELRATTRADLFKAARDRGLLDG